MLNLQRLSGPYCVWCLRIDDILVFAPCGHRYICSSCFNSHAHDTCGTCKQQVQAVQGPNDNVAKRLPVLDREVLGCRMCGESMHPLLLLPCMHYNICRRCIEQTGRQECPICRARIEMLRFPFGHFSSMDDVMNQYSQQRQEEEANVVQAVIVGSSLQTKQDLQQLIFRYCPMDSSSSSRSTISCAANCSLDGTLQAKISITVSTEANEVWDDEITPLNAQVILIVNDKQDGEGVNEYHKWLGLCSTVVGTNIIFIEMDAEHFQWSPSTHISMERYNESLVMEKSMTFYEHYNEFGVKNLFRFMWALPRSGLDEARRLLDRAVVRYTQDLERY